MIHLHIFEIMYVAKNVPAILWDPTMTIAMIPTDNVTVNQELEGWIVQVVCLDSGDSHQKAVQVNYFLAMMKLFLKLE